MKRTVLTEDLDCSNNSLIDLSGRIMCKNIINLKLFKQQPCGTSSLCSNAISLSS